MDNPTNVSSISGLSILDSRSVLSNVYLLPIVCHFSSMTNRMDNPEILKTLVTQDTGHTIGSK
jgi:hypothetical protein